MAVTVTNTFVTAYNTVGTITKNPATSTVAGATEVFTITPTRAEHRVVIILREVSGSAGTVSCSIAAGGYPQAPSSALTVTVAQGLLRVILLDALYKSASGTYVITATPASGQRLLTDHAFSMEVIELPF